jgi:hypothetical protein
MARPYVPGWRRLRQQVLERWVNTDRLTWSQLHSGMLMLTRRIEGQQRRLQELRDLAEEVRPMMEDDPTCTVAQARRQLEELADLLSDALLTGDQGGG